MLSLENITFKYDSENNVDKCNIIDNVSLDFKEGVDVAILGRSGCGKTTLLNIISGLLRPTSGVVRFNGEVLLSPVDNISMIFQNYGLFDWKNVKNNILFPLKLKKEKVDYNEFDELVSKLGLKDKLYKYPSQLSGGEKQRVAIGRALINNASYLLMDEPFSALDPLTREVLRFDIRNFLKEKNVTSIIVTHSIEEAVFFGEKIVIFEDSGGKISHILNNDSAGKKREESIDMINEVRKIIFEKEYWIF